MLHHAQKSWFKLYIWTQLWDEQGSGKVQLLKSCSAAMRRALSFVSVCGVSTGSNTHTRPVKGLSVVCVCSRQGSFMLVLTSVWVLIYPTTRGSQLMHFSLNFDLRLSSNSELTPCCEPLRATVSEFYMNVDCYRCVTVIPSIIACISPGSLAFSLPQLGRFFTQICVSLTSVLLFFHLHPFLSPLFSFIHLSLSLV